MRRRIPDGALSAERTPTRPPVEPKLVPLRPDPTQPEADGKCLGSCWFEAAIYVVAIVVPVILGLTGVIH